MEKRTLTLERMQKREENEKIYLEGYFARFNDPYKLCEGWVETISPGAFARYLESSGEVKVLWNHNHDLVLGSRANGTLHLEERTDGLYGVVEINQEDRAAMDAYARIARGDVSGCSFGFDCQVDSFYDDDGTYRTVIREVNPLYEVSPCTFPAYETTSIEARSRLDEIENKRNLATEQWRENMRIILKGNKDGD